jgi:type II secretory pathway pseudopilin PulG
MFAAVLPVALQTGACMPIGKPHGFTYLALLFMIAITSALAAAGTQRWQTLLAREREAEQIYRAGQIAAALGRYYTAQASNKQFPRSLDDLLEDRRSAVVLRHLRRLYVDPVTGKADWELVTDSSGGIVALRSRSSHPAWYVADLGQPAADVVWLQSDRLYAAVMPAAPASSLNP